MPAKNDDQGRGEKPDDEKIEPVGDAAKGGRARSESLTPEERSEIARKAAEARWSGSLPMATHGSPDHPLKIGGVEIPCYVLEDGRRVITNQGLQIGMKMAKSGGQQRMVALVTSLESKGLECKDLKNSIINPIRFRPSSGGNAFGYEATVLADLCDLILEARKKKALNYQQLPIAAQCEVLLRSFSRVGIIALVDEATGYQYVRPIDELRKELEKFISRELAKWVHTFQLDYYREIYKLRGWSLDPASNKRPSVVAKYTVNLVYDRIHPSLTAELKKTRTKWEEAGGKRHGKLHQFTSTDYGHPRLKQHIEGVIMVARFSKDWKQFMHRMDAAYPKINQTRLIAFPEPDEDDDE